MRQRIFFRTLLGAQFLIFLFAIGAGLYLLWLTRSPEIRADEDAAEAIRGLKIAATACIAPSILWLASFIGILKRQAWGWWLGLSVNFLLFAVAFYDAFSDKSTEAEDWIGPILFLVVSGLHLLSRPTSWRAEEIAAMNVNESSQSAGSGI